MIGLNLASGLHPANDPAWVDVDLAWDGVKPPSVYADAFRLPFGQETFERFYLGHFLEHVPWEGMSELVEVWLTAKRRAEVMVVGPCMKRAIDQNEPPHILNAIIGGGESGWLIEGPGAHKWVPTEALTARAMRLAGLVEIEPVDVREVVRPAWPNPSQATWQCALRARVP